MVTLFGQSITSEEKGGRDSRLTSLGKAVGRQGGLKQQQQVDTVRKSNGFVDVHKCEEIF